MCGAATARRMASATRVTDSLSMRGLVADLDLSGGAQGSESIRVNSRDINLPPGVVVHRVAPSSITLSLSRRQKAAAR
jgi:hypothetical protein